MRWTDRTQTGVEWTICAGEALSVLREIPANTFNCVITSPPYFWLRDYGVETQIGQENTIDEYVKSICTIMDEVQRVICPDGLLFLNLGDTYYSGKGQARGTDPKSKKRRFGLRAVDTGGGMGIGLQQKSLIGIPWRVAIAMTLRKWALRSSIIWHGKQALAENAKDRPSRSYEYVFMFAKNRKYYYNPQSLEETNGGDMWTIAARPKPTNGISTASFPDELVERCLSIGCPEYGTVLDPFVGAGTTVRVAVQSGRSATGIDLNPTFCEFAVEQLRKL